MKELVSPPKHAYLVRLRFCRACCLSSMLGGCLFWTVSDEWLWNAYASERSASSDGFSSSMLAVVWVGRDGETEAQLQATAAVFSGELS